MEGISADRVMYGCSLKACVSIEAIGKGYEVHTEIVRKRLFKRNLIVTNELVDMYVKCRSLAKVREVLPLS